MIDIRIEKSGKSYRRLTLDGHAGFADYGNDIVCAAVSMLVINTINSIERFTDDGMYVDSNEEKGFIDCSFPEGLSHDGNLLMDSAGLGLSAIADQYPDNVSIEFKEE